MIPDDKEAKKGKDGKKEKKRDKKKRETKKKVKALTEKEIDRIKQLHEESVAALKGDFSSLTEHETKVV